MKTFKSECMSALMVASLFAYSLPSLSLADEHGYDFSSFKPYYTLTGCSGNTTTPNGYVWTSIQHAASCGGPGRQMIMLVYESYFDKPVGSSIRVCSNAVVPDGWSLSNPNQGLDCSFTGLPVQQWIITRND